MLRSPGDACPCWGGHHKHVLPLSSCSVVTTLLSAPPGGPKGAAGAAASWGAWVKQTNLSVWLSQPASPLSELPASRTDRASGSETSASAESPSCPSARSRASTACPSRVAVDSHHAALHPPDARLGRRRRLHGGEGRGRAPRTAAVAIPARPSFYRALELLPAMRREVSGNLKPSQRPPRRSAHFAANAQEARGDRGRGGGAGRTERKGESRGCRGAAASGAAPHPRLAASPGPPGGCRRGPTAEHGAAPGAPAGRGTGGAEGTGPGRRRALRDGAAGTGRPGAGLPRRGAALRCRRVPGARGGPRGTGRYRGAAGGSGGQRGAGGCPRCPRPAARPLFAAANPRAPSPRPPIACGGRAVRSAPPPPSPPRPVRADITARPGGAGPGGRARPPPRGQWSSGGAVPQPSRIAPRAHGAARMVDVLLPRPLPGAMGEPSKRRPGLALCAGCGGRIQDPFLLRVSPDLEWHVACLKCAECGQPLDETCTCFLRDGKAYCKRDYSRLFGIKCAQCRAAFSSSDLVMRARDHVYHLECFRCAACGRQLLPGDQFCLRERDLLCRADHGPPPDGAAAARGPRSPALPPAAHLAGTGPRRAAAARGGRRGATGGRRGAAAAGLTVRALPARRRAGARAAAGPAAAGAQGGGEDDPREDGAEREAVAHAADLLRRQPAPRRPDEGAAGGDDGAQPARHPRLVPEQALQGQEEVHPHEAAAAAAARRQDEPAGPHRDAAGGRQPHPARERRAGQRRGGADLPAALEGAQRLRPAERPGAARRLPAAGLLFRVRLLGHVLRQRRDLAVLPAPRHPQQHGAQPGRDVRPPGRPPPPRDFRMPALPA
uniref:LIM zinc-binding domain-containing protein n=1 Tax=Cairina moschata TaxID=8855 RepID=A0A8C3GLN7_CAIMO